MNIERPRLNAQWERVGCQRSDVGRRTSGGRGAVEADYSSLRGIETLLGLRSNGAGKPFFHPHPDQGGHPKALATRNCFQFIKGWCVQAQRQNPFLSEHQIVRLGQEVLYYFPRLHGLIGVFDFLGHISFSFFSSTLLR